MSLEMVDQNSEETGLDMLRGIQGRKITKHMSMVIGKSAQNKRGMGRPFTRKVPPERWGRAGLLRGSQRQHRHSRAGSKGMQ